MRELPQDWRNMRISKNFLLGEFFVSKDRPDLAAIMEPTPQEITIISMNVRFGLQPARTRHGRLKVISGMRSPRLNQAIGGEDTSQHLFAEAIDFYPLDAHTVKVFLWMKTVLNWPGELFYYPNKHFIHMGAPTVWVEGRDQGIIY